MNINELKVEKIALVLLTSFIIILFLDYCFGISQIITHHYPEIKISSEQHKNILKIVLISIIPLIGFISLTEFNKNILSNLILPFLTFVSSFFIYDLISLKIIYRILILIPIQLILFLFIFQLLTPYLSHCLFKLSSYNRKVKFDLWKKRNKK